MEEEQEMERFDMDGEFVDGQWIDGEFFYRSRRQGRRQTKEEALYGYQSDSDSERQRKGSGRTDLTKPVNFVSGSTLGSARAGEENEIRDEPMEDVEGSDGSGLGFQNSRNDEGSDGSGLGFQNSRDGLGFESSRNEERPGSDGSGFQSSRDGLGFQSSKNEERPGSDGSGLGFQTSRGGLGFQSSRNEERPGSDGSGLGFQSSRGGLGFQSSRNEAASSSAEFGTGQQRSGSRAEASDQGQHFPSAFGRRLEEGAERRRAKESSLKNVHVKGIGSKLLEKMGYRGGGLGKDGQGIVEPIQTKIRPKNMGMGYNDYKETTLPAAPGTEGSDDGAVKEQQRRQKVDEKNWQKKSKKKRDYVTADQLLARQQERGAETVQKVLDMRGPQVRVLTDMKELNVEQAPLDDTPMPELQHNLRLIVNLVESDIKNYDNKLRHEEQVLVYLGKEEDRLRTDLDRQAKAVEVYELILSTVASVKQGLQEGRHTLETVATTFGKLKKEHPHDYKLCNVPTVVLSLVLPLMVSHLHGWEPLQQPERGLTLMQICKQLLHETGESIFVEADTSPYTRLIMETVFPYVRRSCIIWEVRKPEPMLRFFEKWKSVLTPSALEVILDQTVMPKLEGQVNAWNPLEDNVAIHSWIHPWLPLLGSKMEPLYRTIRYTMQTALQKWHASDASAFMLLSPWVRVFDAASWEQLLVRSVLPKLIDALEKDLVINPHGQVLHAFDWVKRWFSVVPLHHMVALFEARFFPKWHQALYLWLTSGSPNFEEVERWFKGWKSCFPQQLLSDARIQYQLKGALAMMEQAADGAVVVQPLPYDAVRQAAPGPAPTPTPVFVDDERELSLKEIVEQFAQEHDIKFLPKPERVYQGFQVYGFGGVSIVVDSFKQKVLAQDGDLWMSVSLSKLLDMHRAREKKR